MEASESGTVETVTDVTGTFCNPCLRAGPDLFGGRQGIRTPDPRVANAMLSQLS